MSLWTPSGEHPVDRDRGDDAPPAAPGAGAPGSDEEAAVLAEARAALDGMGPEERQGLIETLLSLGVDDAASLDDEDLSRHLVALSSLAATQQRLLEEPVASHVASHLVGLHQLAALHLSAQQPRLDEARLAIDAMAGLLGATEDHLGDAGPQLRAALTQVQQLFVQISG